MRKVSLKNVKPGMVTRKPILGFLGQTLLNADMEITTRHLYYLKQMGITHIYVHDRDLAEVDVDDLISFDLRSESRALVARVLNDLEASGKNSAVH